MSNKSPIVICGIGGSGTRLIANTLEQHDVYIGDLHNRAKDSLLFNFWMFNEEPGNRVENLIGLKFFLKSCFGNWVEDDIDKAENKWKAIIGKNPKSEGSINLSLAYNKLLKPHNNIYSPLFGWKAPKSLLFLAEIFDIFPLAKVVYVYRHPLDMAFSNNQRQLKSYASYFNLSRNSLPKNSLKYWLAIDQYINNFSSGYSIHKLSFEGFCMRDSRVLRDLQEFIGFELNYSILDSQIVMPDSIGRWAEYDKNQFDFDDVEMVAQLGFNVGECHDS